MYDWEKIFVKRVALISIDNPVCVIGVSLGSVALWNNGSNSARGHQAVVASRSTYYVDMTPLFEHSEAQTKILIMLIFETEISFIIVKIIITLQRQTG